MWAYAQDSIFAKRGFGSISLEGPEDLTTGVPHKFYVDLGSGDDTNLEFEWETHDATPAYATTDTVYFTWLNGETKKITVRVRDNILHHDTVLVRFIRKKPENISDADCFVDHPGTKWDMEWKNRSDALVHYLATPLVGDIDRDGRLEIIAPGGSRYDISTSILIFDDNLRLKKTINTPSTPQYGTTNLLIGDVDNDGYGEIITSTSDRRLICYSHTGAVKWGPTPDAFYAGTDPYNCLIPENTRLESKKKN